MITNLNDIPINSIEDIFNILSECKCCNKKTQVFGRIDSDKVSFDYRTYFPCTYKIYMGICLDERALVNLYSKCELCHLELHTIWFNQIIYNKPFSSLIYNKFLLYPKVNYRFDISYIISKIMFSIKGMPTPYIYLNKIPLNDNELFNEQVAIKKINNYVNLL